jgi:hypothetical protein
MALDNNPGQFAPGSEGKWGDFVDSVGDITRHTPSQVRAAQLSVVEIGAKLDPVETLLFLSMLGIDRKVDQHDDDCKDGR